MQKRDLLSVTDLSKHEVNSLLQRAAELKVSKDVPLSGRSIALMFEKPSLRTRSSFEVGVFQLGGQCIYLGPTEIAMGQREPVSDIAQVAEGYFDAIIARVYKHETLEELASHANVPIVNALSDWEHPCQVLSDALTVSENCQSLEGQQMTYIGDGDNNITRSLALLMPSLGVNLVICSPDSHQLDDESVQAARSRAQFGASVKLEGDPSEAAQGADFIYTDIWASMGKEAEREARRVAFRGFSVTPELIAKAKPTCKLMHDLPASHGDEIAVGMFEHESSIVFPQAHNRLHMQKALLDFLLP